jgi:hypothetical protein
MTNLSALREAVAKMTGGPWALRLYCGNDELYCDWHEISTPDCDGLISIQAPGNADNAAGIVALRNAAPALLDEVEAARAELDLLHTQIDYIKTMQDHKDMNPGDELIALRQSEKHAWDEAAQARIDGAENLMLLTQELQVELAAARAVLETAEYIIVAHRGPVRMIDATAWQAWQERRK